MAMLNEILGAAARYNQLLTRKFNITGGAPAPQLTPEIGCELALDPGPEGRVLASELLCSGRGATTGAAANSGSCELANPAGSNLLTVVEQIIVISGSAVTLGIDVGVLTVPIGLPNIPAAGNVVARDTRVPKVGNYTKLPATTIRTGTNTPPVVVVPNLFRSLNAINVPYTYTVPVVLAPGTAVDIIQSDLASSMVVWFSWREVPLAAGEVGPF